MVQRKAPNLVPSVPADSHPKNPTSEIKSRGADLAKKMKKSSTGFGFKRSDLGTSQPNYLIKQPNYSKSTTSFDARKESICSVNSSHKKTCTTSMRLQVSTTSLTKTSSSFKPTRRFRKLAFCENVSHVQRATCSSTLKDSRFLHDYLELNHGGTQSDGTSVAKVCPYTYCSLNGRHHRHVPLPPFKMGTKPRRAKVNGDREGMDEVVEIRSPQPQLQESRVGIEICVKDGENEGDDTNERSKQVQEDLKAASDESFHAPDHDDAVSIEFDVISDLFSGDCMEESDQAPIDILLCAQDSQAADMDKDSQVLKPQSSDDCDVVNQEQGSRANDTPETWSEENPHERVLQGLYGEESVCSEAWSGEGDPENSFYGEMEANDQQTFSTTIDYEEQDQDETEKGFSVCDAAADVNRPSNQILNQSKKLEHADNGGDKIEMENKEVEVAESVIRIELCNLPQEISEGDQETTDDNGDEVELIDVVEDNEIMSQKSAVSAETQDESSNKEGLSSAETQDDSSDKKSDIAENQHNTENPKESSSDMMEIEVTEASQDTINYMGGQWETNSDGEKTSSETKDLLDFSRISNDEFLKSSKYIRGTRGKRLSPELDDFSREFNPREPSFLPLEPEPDAERVDLRHQIMDDKRNAEEWMLDFALRQVVTRLAPARKRKVELLVEAFEKVIPPIPKCQTHLGHTQNHLLPMRG